METRFKGTVLLASTVNGVVDVETKQAEMNALEQAILDRLEAAEADRKEKAEERAAVFGHRAEYLVMHEAAAVGDRVVLSDGTTFIKT
jgi:hypothetical protein